MKRITDVLQKDLAGQHMPVLSRIHFAAEFTRQLPDLNQRRVWILKNIPFRQRSQIHKHRIVLGQKGEVNGLDGDGVRGGRRGHERGVSNVVTHPTVSQVACHRGRRFSTAGGVFEQSAGSGPL